MRKQVAFYKLGWQAASVLILAASLFSSFSFSAEKLTAENVKDLIPQLFHLHLSQHEMSPVFTKRVIKEYLTQMDPYNRFYLKSEAEAILNKSDDELKALADKVLAGDLAFYNETLQKFVDVQIARDDAFYDKITDKSDDIKKEAERKEATKPVAAIKPDGANPLDIKKSVIEKLETPKTDAKKTETAAADEEDDDPDLKIKWTERPATQEDRMTRLIKFAAGNFRMNKGYLSEPEAMKLALQNVSEEHKKYKKVDVTTETPKMFLKAFMAAMDPHTVYFDGDDEGFGVQLEPSFAGIGVKIRPCPMGCQVDELIKDGPSEKSGKLIAGDQIIAVDGVSLGGLTINKIVQKIKGPKGTDVRLTVLKRNQPTEIVTLRRAEIQLADERVKVKTFQTPQGNIGLISVASFYRGVHKDVKERLIEANKKEPLVGIIMDLRANQGGYLDEAVDMAGLFIETGSVVGERNGAGVVNWMYDKDPFFFSQPLVVLTSQLSASASEIVSGSLKDYNRAIIVGPTQTFGKGTVQRVIPLAGNGLPGEIKITTHQYFCAGGASTQLKGVEPDVFIPGSKLVDDLLEKASDNPVPWNKIPSSVDMANKNVERWTNWKAKNVAMLQENSKKRVDKNQDYKDYFDVKKRKAKYDLEKAERDQIAKLHPNDPPPIEKKKDEKDPQADEAVLIAADMAALWNTDTAAVNKPSANEAK